MQLEVTPLQHLRRDALREIAQSNVQQSDALVKLFASPAHEKYSVHKSHGQTKFLS
jgi:hypothetical protein